MIGDNGRTIYKVNNFTLAPSYCLKTPHFAAPKTATRSRNVTPPELSKRAKNHPIPELR